MDLHKKRNWTSLIFPGPFSSLHITVSPLTWLVVLPVWPPLTVLCPGSWPLTSCLVNCYSVTGAWSMSWLVTHAIWSHGCHHLYWALHSGAVSLSRGKISLVDVLYPDDLFVHKIGWTNEQTNISLSWSPFGAKNVYTFFHQRINYFLGIFMTQRNMYVFCALVVTLTNEFFQTRAIHKKSHT